MLDLFHRIRRRLHCFPFRLINRLSGIEYWEERARRFGKRSVLNLGHSIDEVETVTNYQKEQIYPHFKRCLKGNERMALDFGCGPGRFTADLASIISGHAIGIDPIRRLIDLAPTNEDVEYRIMKNNIVPMDNESVDIVWVCLVMGGIINQGELKNAAKEINRVLKDGGLLFLVENTSEKSSGEYWIFRPIVTYEALFGNIQLEHLSDYFDMGERISIMAGRKNV